MRLLRYDRLVDFDGFFADRIADRRYGSSHRLLGHIVTDGFSRQFSDAGCDLCSCFGYVGYLSLALSLRRIYRLRGDDMDVITPVINFTADLIFTIVEFLRSIVFAPGVSWWSISIVLLFISVTISFFVRSGRV